MTFTEHTSVGDIAAALPSSVRVFEQYGIDFCCGGGKSLGTACHDQGLSVDEITRAIDAACPEAALERDWTHAPLGALTDHIVTTYHDALRTDLPRLQAMAAKVHAVHGARPPLEGVKHVLSTLADELTTHMRKEEEVLFPAIHRADAGREANPRWIAMPITIMEHEHEDAGAMLAELRRLTDDYVPPVWACQTVRALYRGVNELEHSLHLHVHLENNVLFPRAIQLAGEARRS
jgi:regulator of cell morphogenesis and NO signaling